MQYSQLLHELQGHTNNTLVTHPVKVKFNKWHGFETAIRNIAGQQNKDRFKL